MMDGRITKQPDLSFLPQRDCVRCTFKRMRSRELVSERLKCTSLRVRVCACSVLLSLCSRKDAACRCVWTLFYFSLTKTSGIILLLSFNSHFNETVRRTLNR